MTDGRYGERGQDDRAAPPRPVTSQLSGPDEDDDLDRAFGHDTVSVIRRTTGQRVRASSLVAVFVVVVVVAVGATLWVLVGNVQTGIGGIFPAPGTASDRFAARVSTVEGVTGTSDLGTTKTSFASYDVVRLVDTAPGIAAEGRRRILESVSTITGETSGNGIHVYALVRFGDIRVGVSPALDLSEHRLRLAEELAGTDGVHNVTCDWQRGDGDTAIRDRADGTRVVVTSSATGPALTALQQVAQERMTAVLPGAALDVRGAETG